MTTDKPTGAGVLSILMADILRERATVAALAARNAELEAEVVALKRGLRRWSDWYAGRTDWPHELVRETDAALASGAPKDVAI